MDLLVVYEIKCIVDYLLDFVENVTDGILNELKPVLVPLLNSLLISTVESSPDKCANGLEIAGLCLLESGGAGLLG